MENCLKTQLKEVVNNDNLRRLNSFRVKVAENANALFSLVNPTTSGKTVTAYIIGNGYFSDSTYTQNNGKSMTYTQPAGTGTLFCYVVSTGTCAIEVVGIPYEHTTRDIIYGTNAFGDAMEFLAHWGVQNYSNTGAAADLMTFDFDKIAYPALLKSIYIGRSGSNIKGSIDVLSSATNLTSIRAWGNNLGITGNLSTFNNLTNITDFVIGGQVTGTMEGVLESWADAGVSRSLDFNIGDSLATLNGKLMTNVGGRTKDNAYVVITSSSDIKVYKDNASGLLLASYNGSVWTYSNGYES